jgi:hypothetical protein
VKEEPKGRKPREEEEGSQWGTETQSGIGRAKRVASPAPTHTRLGRGRGGRRLRITRLLSMMVLGCKWAPKGREGRKSVRPVQAGDPPY